MKPAFATRCILFDTIGFVITSTSSITNRAPAGEIETAKPRGFVKTGMRVKRKKNSMVCIDG